MTTHTRRVYGAEKARVGLGRVRGRRCVCDGDARGRVAQPLLHGRGEVHCERVGVGNGGGDVRRERAAHAAEKGCVLCVSDQCVSECVEVGVGEWRLCGIAVCMGEEG